MWTFQNELREKKETYIASNVKIQADRTEPADQVHKYVRSKWSEYILMVEVGVSWRKNLFLIFAVNTFLSFWYFMYTINSIVNIIEFTLVLLYTINVCYLQIV